MNNSGQAYSAFKLLIAAIVAVAILAILIPILMNIVIPGNDIQTVTTQMIQKQKDMPGGLDTQGPVKFSPGTNLAPSALVGNSGLSADQICLHKGELADRTELEVVGNTIMHSGTSEVRTSVSVTCNRSNVLVNSINEMGLFDSDIEFDGTVGVCNCPIDSDTATQLCCVVILRYS